MKKKIFVILIILCGGIVLFLLNFGKSDEKAKDINGKTISIKDFIGTWQAQGNNEITLSNGENYKLNDFIIEEIISSKDCLGAFCPQYYYNIDNHLYSYMSLDLGTFCVQLVDKNTLKQVSCDILQNAGCRDKTGNIISSSIEDFNITYKKK